MTLSVVLITKNAQSTITDTLKSVFGLCTELLIDDEGSTDKTVEIIEKYGGNIHRSKDKSLGERKKWLVDCAKGDWLLVIDSDEVITPSLFKEIKSILNSTVKTRFVAFRIPFQKYAFGRRLYYASDTYGKVRLFKRKSGTVTQSTVHEEVVVKGAVGKLNGYIIHNSFRTLPQVLSKFTKYAWQVAGEKRKVHEGVTLKKLFLYGPHMVWARAIKDEGWRDGWRGIVIALCFGYMETLMYWLLLWRNIFQR